MRQLLHFLRAFARFLTLRRAGRDCSLLVIDDDHAMRTAIVLVLREHDFDPIWEADNVETALDLAHLHEPRYIVTDRLLGREGNEEPAAFLRRLLPDTRIVVFSGSPGKPEWADAVVTKPRIDELTRTLDCS